MQLEENSEFRVLVTNPNKHEGAGVEMALEGIEELKDWLESSLN
jgi:hypothetical protein